MLDIGYEALRLDIQGHLKRLNTLEPYRIENIHERASNEVLLGEAVSEEFMLRVGQVAVPLVNLPFLRSIGARATAVFAETRAYGPSRRIWLPGFFYGRENTPNIAVTHSETLAEAWDNLGEALYEPIGRQDYGRYTEDLLKEARGIAKGLGVASLHNISRAVLLFPTK